MNTKQLNKIVLKVMCFFYPPKFGEVPNFGEVEGAYWFGPVRPSVSPSVRNTLAAEKHNNRLC